jgi:hypothetical protein
VGFEPKGGFACCSELALAGATQTIQEVDGLLPGPAGLLRLATITPGCPPAWLDGTLFNRRVGRLLMLGQGIAGWFKPNSNEKLRPRLLVGSGHRLLEAWQQGYSTT